MRTHIRSRRLLRGSALFFAAITLIQCGSGSRIAPGINAAAIRRVKVGMTKQQVTTILGQPVRIRSSGPDEASFDYAVTRLTGPTLWVHFDKDVVTTVQAKRHSLLHDKAVYEEAAHHATFETAEFEPLFNPQH